MTHAADWTEGLRRKVWPALHPLLKRVGGYAIGVVGEDQHVGTTDLDEERLEEILHEVGFRTNLVAALKHDRDGRWSEKSCVWRRDPLADCQLHVTLFNARDGDGMDVFAHWEYSWRTHPIKHLRAVGLSGEVGVEKTAALLPREVWEQT